MASDAPPLITYLGPPLGGDAALDTLPPILRFWFRERFGDPTLAQRLAWPLLASDANLLLCAPTGTGKTLAAFLPVISRLFALSAPRRLRCVFVSPLKALVNDVRRTLRRHLREIGRLAPADVRIPRVGLRTGDTTNRLRRLLVTDPPEILLTTPESLAIMLCRPASVELLRDVRWVIVDEVHALAPCKRGADLSLALERLEAAVAGPVQRIGLSATCAPVDEAARFLVGVGRPCAIATVAEMPELELTIEPLKEDEGFVAELVDRLRPELSANRSTLIFANTRSLAERLGWALRRRYPHWDAEIAVHHSSLAAARRRSVERRFKQGSLRAVVCSTSLELGIDIGTVDGVVLVHPPGCVVRLLQRVGRSGHEPRRPRRGLILTAGIAELLEAAVTCASTRPARFEPLRIPDAPLDVLCQHLLGMSAAQSWTADEAFEVVRMAYPYRRLARRDLDACLQYLGGRRGDDNEWLTPRLAWEGERFRILDRRTTRILLRNTGTIVREEPRRILLRLSEGDGDREQELGTVDERYADRLQPGDRFLLDGRCLECRQPGPGDLLVEEVAGRPAVPRWQSDGVPMSGELARRLFLLRIQAAEALRQGPTALRRLLMCDYGLLESPALELADFFALQEQHSEIPNQNTCLCECVCSQGAAEHYIHTPLGHAANDALARVAVLRLARAFGRSATSIVADLGFALLCRRSLPLSPDQLRLLFRAEDFETDVREALRDSITLRERFRRVANIGLMLLRHPLGARRRVGGQDWADRRLFDMLRAAEPEFILLRQAEKETLATCDVAGAAEYVTSLPRLEVKQRRLEAISPFAACWTQQSAGSFAQNDGPAEALRNLHQALFERATA